MMNGVEKTIAEDIATEEQLITPWTISVSRCEERSFQLVIICFNLVSFLLSLPHVIFRYYIMEFSSEVSIF